MNNDLIITPLSLALAFVLVLVAMAISHREKLGLEKEMLIAVLRMVAQLLVVGYLLAGIFRVNKVWVTLIMVAVILINAAWNAAKRAEGLKGAFAYSLLAIVISSAICLTFLVISGNINFIPSQIVPIVGMMAGNIMRCLSMAYSRLKNDFKSQRGKILERLALGASPKQASQELARQVMRDTLQPTLDNIKTVGIVSLPGAMTGMMFAGIDPTMAILYQSLVFFMILGGSAIAVLIAVRLITSSFFNDRAQLQLPN